jgi:hypothetical protein
VSNSAISSLKKKPLILFGLIVVSFLVSGWLFYQKQSDQSSIDSLTRSESELKNQLDSVKKEFEDLKNHAATAYEQLVEIKLKSKNTAEYDKTYAASLKLLADRKYTEAQTKIDELKNKIKDENSKLAAAAAATAAQAAKIPDTAPANNSAPGSGHSRQKVHSEVGDFIVDIVAADLGSHKVIADTASGGDCRDNCPVMPLANYVARNGAVAGINGPYFCPASYPSCAGKTNSFDTLLLNKDKKYFNSDNNVYSVVPAIIFSGSSVRVVSRSLEWGRDTSPDSVIANYPLLTMGGQVVGFSTEDQKLTARGPRSFLGHKGSTAYMGFVHNANIYEAAKVVQALGIENAIHLDDGGSTALWHGGGYKLGPGRELPVGILFVRR